MNYSHKLYKVLQLFCLFVIISCRKLVLSLELSIIFDERFKVPSVSFFIFYFNLLSCELDNFTYTLLH